MTAPASASKERALGSTTTVLTSAGTTTFAYDFESRATSITGPGISQTNVYNGLDTRTGSTTNSVAQTYLRDGAYVTDPVLKDSSATYTPGVSERRGSATTFLHSGLKNADAQTGTAQTVSATRRYDAFGNVVGSTGIWNGPFGYAGGFGYQEDATGLKLLGHRYYDSSTGRFLTRDPIKDGRNWFVYCANDPTRMADPSGLILPVVIVIGAGALIGGIIGAINDPQDPWRGAGRGAAVGGVAAGVGFIASVGAAAVAGAAGIGGWLGGGFAGAAGGFAGSVGSQAFAVALAWQEEIDWWNVGAGTVTGGIGGSLFIRPVPTKGPVPVTHWGKPSPWVQAGDDSTWNWYLAGKPPGSPSTTVVDGSSLRWPGGLEWGKGLVGQRILD